MWGKGKHLRILKCKYAKNNTFCYVCECEIGILFPEINPHNGLIFWLGDEDFYE